VSTLGVLPDEVTVCAIGYRVKVHEGAVHFTESESVYGCRQQIVFDRRCGCWYVSITGQQEAAMASHITKLHELVSQWFGGNHDCPRGEHRP
jgi:hypothetical protein